MTAILRTIIPNLSPYRGKVRDVYDLGDQLAIVATDRISAFDWVMPQGIPGKGALLTAMTHFWLDWLKVPNHRLLDPLPAEFAPYANRTMLSRKAKVIPFECVARGYLLGTGWKEYQKTGTVCGITLPAGLQEASQLPEPIFTPATKAELGQHDENVSFEVMSQQLGTELASQLRSDTLSLYRRAAEYARERGVIIADTKFEFGTLPSGEVILIDEVLTPDSSRFWPAESYRAGSSPASFDKQYLRDWLETTTWDKASPPPDLPEEIIEQTAKRYAEALSRLTSS
ncbi:MAG: phosphoribosylaminoimidazolesuccinocarboxamide synthase [Fimbriiglobus sp.]